MKNILHLDLETRSAIDLGASGVYVYAEHPSTEILVACYALDDEPVKTWFIIWGFPLPEDLRAHLLNPSVTIASHNSSFERTMLQVTAHYKGYLSTDILKAITPAERWSCTAVRSAACGLPRSLDGAANALRLPIQKDLAGKSLMLEMCFPRGLTPDGRYIWKEDPPSVARLADYCVIDVEVEREIDKLLPELSPREAEVWHATTRLNDRGIQLDGDFVEKMVGFVKQAEVDLNARINRLTNGRVPKVTNTQKLKAWLEDNDLAVENVGKNTLKEILTAHIAYEEELKKAGGDERMLDEHILDGRLPEHVKEVLVLRRDGGKSSAGKFKSAAARMNTDARARGSILYCGAASTGRFCLAEGSLVLVQEPNGTIRDKAIETVDLNDKVWDGDHWVSHEGVVFSGDQDVMHYQGITATPDHEVFISDTEKVPLSYVADHELELFSGNRMP